MCCSGLKFGIWKKEAEKEEQDKSEYICVFCA